MAAAAFFGHALIALGPGLAFFVVILAPKSFVVLLSLFSAFYWLCVLLVTSAIFRGFVPLAPSAGAYAGAILAAVSLEEAARVGVWRLHRSTLAKLHRMSIASGHAFTRLDELYLALGWGYGQAAVHVLFLFGGLLPLTAAHGTLYAAACPAMSVFLVGALNSLGLGATLVALSVIALDAWARRSLGGMAFAPLMHAGAALLTLGSMRPGGCVPAVACQLGLGLANTYLASLLAWRGGGPAASSSDGGHREQGQAVATGGAAVVPAQLLSPRSALPAGLRARGSLT